MLGNDVGAIDVGRMSWFLNEIEVANRERQRLASTRWLDAGDASAVLSNSNLLRGVVAASATYLSALILAVVRCRFFKLYNDTYGHLAADLGLQRIAKAMFTILAHDPTAIIACYSGEAFAVITSNLVSRSITLSSKCEQRFCNLKFPILVLIPN